jgi:CDP-diacylglycerol--glycerol-3-phosphate 3-phosphatidyltransferase
MAKFRTNIPFYVTISRLVFLPLLFWLMFAGHLWWFLGAYIVVGFTDWLDGYLARKLNQVTPGGHLLDTVADLPFYISSAYFLNYLFPVVIANNLLAVRAFFTILGFVILVSFLKFRSLHLLHTTLLRLNGVLVYLVVIASFFFDTTWFVRIILWLYFVALAEELAIFFIYGQVNPDTPSIFHIRK